MNYIPLTSCMNYKYREKTGNNISEFTHSNWITVLLVKSWTQESDSQISDAFLSLLYTII